MKDAQHPWETGTEILPIKSRLLDYGRVPAGTYLTTGRRAQRGYRLGKFCASLMSPAARDAFKADPDGVMRSSGLDDYEQALVRARDWNGMLRYGLNAFLLLKLSNVVGVGQNRTGAAMRGQTYEEFMATRNVKDAS